MADDATLKRVLAALDSIRSNVPHQLDKKDIDQYHGELDRLADLGYEVQEWRIPDAWFEKSLRSQSYINPNLKKYSDPYVQQYRFLTKLDALLNSFSIEGKKVGFEGPPAGAAPAKADA